MLTPKELTEALEKLIDKNGLDNILSILIEICELKAEHIRDNWQDMDLAQAWYDASVAIAEAKKNTTSL